MTYIQKKHFEYNKEKKIYNISSIPDYKKKFNYSISSSLYQRIEHFLSFKLSQRTQEETENCYIFGSEKGKKKASKQHLFSCANLELKKILKSYDDAKCEFDHDEQRYRFSQKKFILSSVKHFRRPDDIEKLFKNCYAPSIKKYLEIYDIDI